MTRYLLDTNIISDATKWVASPLLLEWMAEELDDDLFLSSLSLAEIRRGVLEKPAGKKRRELEEWFAGPEGPQALFEDGCWHSIKGCSGVGWSDVRRDGGRQTEECLRHGRRCDRRGQRLPCRN